MIIKEKQEFLVMKINSEMSDFYEEHKKILEQNGYVWFCKFEN